MNTPKRSIATQQDIDQILLRLKSLSMEGDQAAMIIDELHDCIGDSLYQEIGSVDLNEIAGRMLAEQQAFSGCFEPLPKLRNTAPNHGLKGV